MVQKIASLAFFIMVDNIRFRFVVNTLKMIRYEDKNSHLKTRKKGIMKKLLFSGLFGVLAFALSASAQSNDSSKVVKVSIQPEASSTTEQKSFTITLEIAKGWHVYANPVGNPDLASVQTNISVKSEGTTLPAKVTYPAGMLVQDAIVGNYSTYEGTVKIKVTAPLPRNQGQAPEVVVKYQACNEKSCLAPAVANLKLP
jgi:DsbC/DsbD-like thiol-disulfide interchange protein